MEVARGADPGPVRFLISLAHVCTTLIVLRQARTLRVCCHDSSTATKGPEVGTRHKDSLLAARTKGPRCKSIRRENAGVSAGVKPSCKSPLCCPTPLAWHKAETTLAFPLRRNKGGQSEQSRAKTLRLHHGVHCAVAASLVELGGTLGQLVTACTRHDREQELSVRCGHFVACAVGRTHRLLELLGVDDGGAGLATSEDALLETRVERRVVVRVVGCADKRKDSQWMCKSIDRHERMGETYWLPGGACITSTSEGKGDQHAFEARQRSGG